MQIYTGEKLTLYTTSIHTGEPRTHDLLFVSFIKNPVHRTKPLSIPLVKNELFCSQKLLN